MTPRNAFLILLAIVALVIFAIVARQLSQVSIGLAANRETQEVLRRSLEDQKALARADPAHRDVYRRRFEETRQLLARMEIVALTRQQVRRQVELVLVGLVTLIVAAGIGAYFVEQRSVMTRERKRRQSLEHLSAWQEAARRHAHEMRTPLTAAHLEIRQLVQTMRARLPDDEDALRGAEASILEELEQLRRFANDFVAFANVGTPKFEVRDVTALVVDFCATFAPNWPGLALHCSGDRSHRCAAVDREMLRRVLVNLCNNSALAMSANVTFAIGGADGRVTVDVADDGPGIAPEVRRRIFEPYTTTRKTGEGMGLGLAISKKILLDHGGDLELIDVQRGAAFRLTLPSVPCRE